MSIDIRHANYVPTIFLRQAELLAVKELPEAAKDILCPIFCLKPWATAHKLDAAIDKIVDAYPNRQFFLDVDPFVSVEPIKREAQKQFLDLIDVKNGHENWIQFFNEHENAFPCLIANHGNAGAVEAQVQAFSEKEKPFLVRLNRENGKSFSEIIEVVCKVEHSNFAFVIDVGWNRDLLSLQGWADPL